MYESTDVAARIKELAKQRKITAKQLLTDAGLGNNMLTMMRTSMPKADNLAKIADVLDCSVDYLLGRSPDPRSHKGLEGTPDRLCDGCSHNACCGPHP